VESTHRNLDGTLQWDDITIHNLILRTTADVAARAFVATLRTHGFTVEWRAFLPDPHADPRRIASLAWDGSLAALVALVVPPTAPPGTNTALVAALYPDLYPDVPATLQLKVVSTFVSVTACAAFELIEALAVFADRVAAAERLSMSVDGERCFVYLDGRWFAE